MDKIDALDIHSSIFHGSDLIIFVLNENYNIELVNDNAIKFIGYSEPIVGKDFTNFIYSEDVGKTFLSLKTMFNSSENKEKKNIFMVNKDGNILLLNFSFSIIIKNDKNYLVLMGSDISEKIMTREGQKVERYKFDKLFNNPGIGIAFIDLNSIYVDVNESFCKLLGYSKNDLLGLSPHDITYKRDEATVNYISKELLSGNRDYIEVQKRYKKKDGFYIWVSVLTTLIKGDSGKPTYFLALIQDISDKKYYAGKLKQEETKYRTLFNRSLNPIVYKKLIYDKDGNIVDYIILDANEAFEKVTGLKRADIIGRPMKTKAKNHFNVSYDENMRRLLRYDEIFKNGKDVLYKNCESRTFQNPIDVYYYIVDKKQSVIAVVFGMLDDKKAIFKL